LIAVKAVIAVGAFYAAFTFMSEITVDVVFAAQGEIGMYASF
jgi:hypothetical protein